MAGWSEFMLRTAAALCVWLAAAEAWAVWLPISDEFDVPGTTANWNRIEQTEGWNKQDVPI